MKTTIIGDQNKFAIESSISRVYESLSFRALGFFVLHIHGQCYGVKSDEATMLACSFDEVQRRISRRGSHTAPFSNESDASLIATAVYDAIYDPQYPGARLSDILPQQLKKLVFSRHIRWAPDGDEAFDDGSWVLHFDVDSRVRLIAFTLRGEGENNYYPPNPQTLSDQWLDADEFYGILKCWYDAFESDWLAAPKTSENS